MPSATQTITLRVPATLLERIDRSAKQAGDLLGWRPDAYDEPTEAEPRSTRQAGRATNG